MIRVLDYSGLSVEVRTEYPASGKESTAVVRVDGDVVFVVVGKVHEAKGADGKMYPYVQLVLERVIQGTGMAAETMWKSIS